MRLWLMRQDNFARSLFGKLTQLEHQMLKLYWQTGLHTIFPRPLCIHVSLFVLFIRNLNFLNQRLQIQLVLWIKDIHSIKLRDKELSLFLLSITTPSCSEFGTIGWTSASKSIRSGLRHQRSQTSAFDSGVWIWGRVAKDEFHGFVVGYNVEFIGVQLDVKLLPGPTTPSASFSTWE